MLYILVHVVAVDTFYVIGEALIYIYIYIYIYISE